MASEERQLVYDFVSDFNNILSCFEILTIFCSTSSPKTIGFKKKHSVFKENEVRKDSLFPIFIFFLLFPTIIIIYPTLIANLLKQTITTVNLLKETMY